MPQFPKLERQKNATEEPTPVEQPFHRPPYDPRRIMPLYLIQVFGLALLRDIPIRGQAESISHANKSLMLSRLAEAHKIFFQPENGSQGSQTHYYRDERRSILGHILGIKIPEKIAQELSKITNERICLLARVDPRDLRVRGLLSSLELAHQAAERVDPTPTNLFHTIFLSDFMAGLKDPAREKATITDILGVYSHMRTIKAESSPTPTSPYGQMQRVAGVAIAQFLHNQAGSAGHYHDSEFVFHPENIDTGDKKKKIAPLKIEELSQLGSHPQQLQQDATNLQELIRAPGGWHRLIPHNPILASSLESTMNTKEFTQAIDRTPIPPGDQTVVVEVSPHDPDVARFRHRNLHLSPTEKGLRGLPLRLINKQGTHFLDIDAQSFLDLPEAELKALMETTDIMPRDPHWRPLDSVRDEKYKGNWPLFCFSLSASGELPPKVASNLSSRGSSMLHFDFRPNLDGTTQFWTHPSHAVLDATAVETYLNSLGAVLPYTTENSPTSLTMHLAPIYDTEKNPTRWSGYQLLFNITGHSQAIVAESFPSQIVDTQLNEIGNYLDPGTSAKILENFNELFTGENAIENLETFRNHLVDFYPQELQKRFELLNQNIQPPAAQTDRERLLDFVYDCLKKPELITQLRFGEKITATINHKLAFINIFDAIVAAKKEDGEEGVLNCVLPTFFPHKRLVLSGNQGFDKPVMDHIHHYQSLTEEEKADYRLPAHIFTSALDTLDLDIAEQNHAALGISIPNHLATLVGSTKDKLAPAGEYIAPEIGALSSSAENMTSIINTPTKPSQTQIFITAGSMFNTYLSKVHGCTNRPDGTGLMTSRVDLVKSPRAINHLDLSTTIQILNDNPSTPPAAKVILIGLQKIIGKFENRKIFDVLYDSINKEDGPMKVEMFKAVGLILDTALHLKLKEQLADTLTITELLSRGPAKSGT